MTAHPLKNQVEPMPLDLHGDMIADSGEEVGGQADEVFWHGSRSNEPQTNAQMKKHVFGNCGQLKPWMRISLPIKVVSIEPPKKAEQPPKNQ